MKIDIPFTSKIVPSMQIIEQSRTEKNLTVLPPTVAKSLRMQAQVRSTHYSTHIDGTRLVSRLA